MNGLNIVSTSSVDPTVRRADGVTSDPNEMSRQGEYVPTEPILAAVVDKVLSAAEQIAEAWKKRVEAEGKVYWVSPFDKGKDRPAWPDANGAGRSACMDYIKANHHNQIALMKLEGKNPESWEPQRMVVPPKKTLADYYPPSDRLHIEAALAAKTNVAPIIMQSKTNNTETNRQVSRMHLPPLQLAVELKNMSVGEIQSLGRSAHFAGKTTVARVARLELKSRGVSCNWM
jgi:hypothetical protein